ncbi:MAG: tetratricopeptide repeat protein [Planctomycetota bacterium]|jgi:tetratricopeptide (TPR) repeat protein
MTFKITIEMLGKKYFTIGVLSLLITFWVCSIALAARPVKIWQGPLVVPTYKPAPPDKNPMFYDGEVYQGAKKVIYPYPFLDKLTDERKDKTYNAVYLENDYVKICFLPELGGRLFSALDKTNNYDFFYRQHVIKPALIGMLGAWISGGIEWCVLHHHRATTFMPVDYTLAENPDGSKTLWIGEAERRHRIKWILGATLHPDTSYLEVNVKIFNRTAFTHSFLYWANVAVHANPDYQVIFPPSTRFATYHAKNQFSHWPVSKESYNRVDYTDGVDVTWWKNHPEPTSFFAWDLKEDFSGGYDHGKAAGVIHIGSHHVVAGAKLWEWSPGPRGQMWDKILTETDGPYAELMVGAYSDNQPDYSWIKPYEVKTFTQYWYPIRQLGAVKNANLNAAVNLELKPDHTAIIGFNTTSQYPNARLILNVGDRVLFEKQIDIGPDKPFVKEVPVSAGIKETDLRTSLFTSANEELITYKPVKQTYDPNLPEVVQPPPAPEDIDTVEELYLTALRIEQFHNPTLDPYSYYKEALKRDPGDSRVNIALAIDYNKRSMFEQAEKNLKLAIERISHNYTRPRNNEAYYQLGLAQKGRKKYEDAYDSFYKATWDYTFHSAAYYQLAEISCIKQDLPAALDHINRSLATNQFNTRALNAKTTILRKLGRLRSARETASKVLEIDPLDFWAANELYLLESAAGLKTNAAKILKDLKIKMRDDVQSYLELAVDYANLASYDDAIQTLLLAAESNEKPLSTYPLLYYYLGHLCEKKADTDSASKYYDLAAKMPPDHCFPYRAESIDVLNSAVAHNPSDARAYYYLGNLLYDIQPENAIKAWEKSARLDDSFPTVHRNLGWACYRTQNNIQKAIAAYEKSVGCDDTDPRLFAELDVIYEVGGVSPQKRLALLEKNHKTVLQRDDSLLRQIMLLVQLARFDDAVQQLSDHHFHLWEGGGEVHGVYVDTYLLRGIENFQKQEYQQALRDYQAAGLYPENLEVGRPRNDRRAPQVNYFIATAHDALGSKAKAEEFYEKSANQQATQKWPQTRYYQGLALAKLGRTDQAEEIFDHLIATGTEKLEEDISMDFFAKFGQRQNKEARLADAHYIIGLGYLGSGQIQKAKDRFRQAADLNINHIWAAAHLEQLEVGSKVKF